MKLVEILARELEVWPEDAQELGQWPGREVCIRAAQVGMSAVYVFTASHAAEDYMQAWVTRPQWQAERDRMKAMEFIDRTPQGLVDQLQRVNEPTYEQQLWDRVYEESWKHAMKACDPDHVTQEMFSHMTECAGAIADAFMAERAKRVGK